MAGILLLCAAARPQDAGKQAQATSEPAALKLNVFVLDGKNQLVTGLRQEDFQVFEGDAPQTITYFSTEGVPVSYGLLVDSSRSLMKQFKSVLEAGSAIINGNEPGDEAFVLRFIDSENISLAQDLTSDKVALLHGLSLVQVGVGQTAVVDALYVSAEHLAKRRPGGDVSKRRRALVLISDGEERHSVYKREELAKLLRREDIQIFAIGLINELEKQGGFIRLSPREQAVKFLEELARETGGRALFPRSASELPAAAEEVTRTLHTQYTIGYVPAAKAGKDSYRKVRVRLVNSPGRDKLKVIARPGYTAPGSK